MEFTDLKELKLLMTGRYNEFGFEDTEEHGSYDKGMVNSFLQKDKYLSYASVINTYSKKLVDAKEGSPEKEIGYEASSNEMDSSSSEEYQIVQVRLGLKE